MKQDRLNIPKDLDGSVWKADPGRTMRAPHIHRELEMNLVVRGRALYLLGNRRYEIQARTLVWLFPAQAHVLVERSDDLENWVAVFRPDMVCRSAGQAEYATLCEKDPRGQYCRLLSRVACDRLDGLAREAADCVADPDLHNAVLAHLLLASWRAFLDADSNVSYREVHPAVENAARILRSDPAEMGFGELARQAGSSRSRLSRLFREQMGVSLVEFRQRARVERFCRIYGTGQRINMLEAAYEAGFGSYAQFFRVFKSVMGCTPSAYRRSL